MKAQCPKNDPVIEFAFERVYRILEEDISRVDVIANVFLKQRG